MLPSQEDLLKSFYRKPHRVFFSDPLKTTSSYNVYGWTGGDTEKDFESNYKTFTELLQPYFHSPIEYRINKSGFRCPYNFADFYQKDVDIALGCSFTFGVGMYEEFTWPSVLSGIIDRKIINLGVSGGSADLSYICLNKVIDIMNIRNVFLFQPVFPRYYSYFKNYHSAVSPAIISTSIEETFSKNYVINTLTDDGFSVFNHSRAIDAIRGLCYRKNINLYILDKPDVNSYFILKNESIRLNKKVTIPISELVARDLLHPSKLTHEKIAFTFKNLLK